jgi:peptide/nickel transport system ATP-binding protein
VYTAARHPFAPRGLAGDPPDPSALPPGCTFHPRCPVALESCAVDDQPLREVDGDRRAACVRVGEDHTGAPAAAPLQKARRSTP